MLKGSFIGVKENVRVFTLEKTFFVGEQRHATLRATALGLYFAKINGIRVGDAYLTPGWTSYNKMLQVQEYDITDLLRSGWNTISLTVAEGWYCGELTWYMKRNFYGNKTAVCADIIVDGKNILSTDSSWSASDSIFRESSIYNGEIIDFTAELTTLSPYVVDFDKSVMVPQISEPVRTTQFIPAKTKFLTPNGELVYDFGQNIAGVVQIETPKEFNGTIELSFAEILVNGNFYTDNLRSAKATDKFTVKGKRFISPEFTFHGFRYMRMIGADLPLDKVNAEVRHTDMRRTGYIETSNSRFNRLYANVLWGQCGNFVDIPTDCPQRDERLGWTGDINAFCTTAAYNYDVRKILRKWLADLRNDQGDGGEIPFVAPDVLNDKHSDAMWCDAITMVPWALYNMYGDISYLSDNIEAMKKFVIARENTMTDGLIADGPEFSDWLALDVEIMKSTNPCGRTDPYFLTNALHTRTLDIIARSLRILNRMDEAVIYENKRQDLLDRIHNEYFTQNGRLAVDTITAHTISLYFDIVPDGSRAKLAKKLNNLVLDRGCRTITGFIGTPFLLFALTDNGYLDTARKLLLNNGYPGWLYEVDMGATTIWERWNSLMPDGTPNPDGMNSYNHYSYGSVMEFVYRRIAGIEATKPGFASIKIAPHPIKGLPELKVSYESVVGKIVSSYTQKDGVIVYHIEVPNGIKTDICLPNNEPITINGGSYDYVSEYEDLHIEPFTLESYVTEVFDNPKALKAFDEVFNGLFQSGEINWMKDKPQTLEFMAKHREYEGKLVLSDFPQMLAKANSIFKKLTAVK